MAVIIVFKPVINIITINPSSAKAGKFWDKHVNTITVDVFVYLCHQQINCRGIGFVRWTGSRCQQGPISINYIPYEYQYKDSLSLYG